MIVKNEEKVIERCLSTVSHLVDEVIVVDTGSTDRTKEIVSNYTSNIYDFKWVDDFSEARNFASSKASGEWILVLDADEYVDEDNFNLFVEQLRTNGETYDAYTAKILNFTGSFGENLVQNFHDRIYKNNGDIKYYRKIHEQFMHLHGKELNIGISNLLIFHSGYIKHTVQEKDKNKRNKELLEQEMEMGVTNAFDYFNFGNEYYSIGEFSKALDCYLKAYKQKRDFRLSWVSTTLVQIVICLMQLKRYNEALNVIRDAESIYQTSPEFPFLRGEIFYLRGQLDDAKKAFQEVINNDALTHIVLRPDLKDQLPHRRLGAIYLYEENYQKSIFHFVSVLNINKYCDESITKIIYILTKFHNNQEIKDFLETKELINKSTTLAYAKGAIYVGNAELALMLLENYKQEYGNFYTACEYKMIALSDEVGSETTNLHLLNIEIIAELRRINWINIVDLDLIRNKPPFKYSEGIQNYLHNDKEVGEFNCLMKSAEVEEINEELFVSVLTILLNYKKLGLIDILLGHVSKLSQMCKAKTGAVLFSFGYKAEALHLYEQVDWNLLEKEDFLNIANSLVETNLIDNAINVSKYAMSIYPEDFRFYKLIIETTDNEDLLRGILLQAKTVFNESLYF
nr:glycosyltransferase family 2 protein [Robertmurraya korlensis]